MNKAGVRAYLFAVGSLWPLLSYLTLAVSFYQAKVNKKNVSPVVIPLLGPLLIDAALLMRHAPPYWLALPWVLDPGTWFALPPLIKAFWSDSVFNRLALYEAPGAPRSVALTLQKDKEYLLNFRWTRSPGELGLLQVNDLGTYRLEGTPDSDGCRLFLTSHLNITRELVVEGGRLKVVSEDEGFGEERSVKGISFVRKDGRK